MVSIDAWKPVDTIRLPINSNSETVPLGGVEILNPALPGLRYVNTYDARTIIADQQKNKVFFPNNRIINNPKLVIGRTAQIIDNYGYAAPGQSGPIKLSTHSRGVKNLVRPIGERMGITENAIRLGEEIAHIHDLSKAFIPNDIILKPDKLTDEEWAIVRKHAGNAGVFGKRVLELPTEYTDLLANHHKPYSELPDIEQQAFNTADIFEALTAPRNYPLGMDDPRDIRGILRHMYEKGILHPAGLDAALDLVNTGRLVLRK